MATYLEFENGIKQIDEDISNAKIKGDIHAVEILEKNLEKEISKTYKNLTEYQKLQLARHPDCPYALDYIRALLRDSYEIHGDRNFADDAAIVCYIGYLGARKVLVIGEQKVEEPKIKSNAILVCLILRDIEKRSELLKWQKNSIFLFSS